MREEVTATSAEPAAAGKYLTFKLDVETYGVAILKVHEIIGMMVVARMPRTPEFVRGVINLRGKVIPVVDLRLKFEMESHEDTEKTCIIVVQTGAAGQEVTMGVLVDEVAEVLDVAASQIEPPPSFGSNLDTEFILAMGKIGESVVMLLDMDKVLSSDELNALQAAIE